MDKIYELAEFLEKTSFEEIPPEAVESAKTLLLDIIATITAGSTAPTCREVEELYAKRGGAPESHILVYGDKVPAASAAFVNTLMAHSRDFDDTHEEAIIHTGVSVVSTALAVAEQVGGVSGKQFLKAIVMAVDVFTRLALASELSVYESGWVFTSLFAYFANAMSASLLHGHNAEQIVNSAGIVLSQASGIHQVVKDSAFTKRMQPAFAAKAAVEAAELTEIGVGGCKNVLEGAQGLYKVYFRRKFNPETIVADLGKKYYINELSYKPYPSCRFTHSAIDDVRILVKKYGIKPEEITGIDVETTDQCYMTVIDPLPVRQNPKSVVEGQFSIPFTMCSAIVNGTVDMNTFEEANRNNPEVLRLTALVHPSVNEEIDKEFQHGIGPSRVTIHTERGDFTEFVTKPKGHYENPMTKDEILEKLFGVKTASACPVKDGGFENIVSLVDKLETLDEISPLFAAIDEAYAR